jgi:hypothetical protein
MEYVSLCSDMNDDHPGGGVDTIQLYTTMQPNSVTG